MAVDRYSGGTIKLDGKIVKDVEAQFRLAQYVATSVPQDEVGILLDQMGLREAVLAKRRAKRLRGSSQVEVALDVVPDPRAATPVRRPLAQPTLRGRRVG